MSYRIFNTIRVAGSIANFCLSTTQYVLTTLHAACLNGPTVKKKGQTMKDIIIEICFSALSAALLFYIFASFAVSAGSLLGVL